MAGGSAEAETEQEPAEADDRPAPDEDASDRGQAEEEEGKEAGRRREVADRDRERADPAERALQLLLVAEASEIGLVASLLVGGRCRGIHHERALQSELTRN